VILFIDELHTIIGAGAAEGAVSAGNLLKPALARGELRCIGATTLDEYRKHVEKDPAFERRFQPILVDQPSVEETVAILRGLKERYEAHHGVRILDSAILAAAQLSHRYIADRFLPDKAIDLIDEAASKLRIENDSMPTELDELRRRIMQLEMEREALKLGEDGPTRDKELERIERELEELQEKNAGSPRSGRREGGARGGQGAQERAGREARRARAGAASGRPRGGGEDPVRRHPRHRGGITTAERALDERQGEGRHAREGGGRQRADRVDRGAWTGIPCRALVETEREKLRGWRRTCASGWSGRTTRCARCRTRCAAPGGAGRPDRPIGSFLFLGPTGVGKTETCKALAEFLFDTEEAVVRST
jgi:ATP-dependent Clp protease ATP-binding subunit ClpB